MSTRIAVSTGEPSGDEHLSKVLNELRAYGDFDFRGMGGSSVRKIGVETVVDSESLGALMGFHEVLLSARQVLSSWVRMKKLLYDWRPDLLILVDYPDFNLRLAKYAKKLGIKTFYYITPQIWAWRAGRVEHFKKYIDRAAVIFPFEQEFFENLGYKNSIFVGHPFNDTLKALEPAEQTRRHLEFLAKHELNPALKTLAIFPGSRPSEVQRFAPLLKNTCQDLLSSQNQLQIVIAAAPSVERLVRKYLTLGTSRLKIIDGASIDILRFSDAALMKSGTSNLQAAFLGTPFSMFFKVPWLSKQIIKHAVKLKAFSIVNVIRPDSIREILQDQVNPSVLVKEAESLLYDDNLRAKITSNLSQVRKILGALKYEDEFENFKTESSRTAVTIMRLLGHQ